MGEKDQNEEDDEGIHSCLSPPSMTKLNCLLEVSALAVSIYDLR